MDNFMIQFNKTINQDDKEKTKEKESKEISPKLKQQNDLSKQDKAEVEKYKDDTKKFTSEQLSAELKKKEALVLILEDAIRTSRQKKQEADTKEKKELIEEKELKRELLKLELLREEIRNRAIKKPEEMPQA